MKRILIIVLSLFTALIMTDCTRKYRVDYCGQKQFYHDAKDSYAAGETVTVYYYMIATDTSYSFYLNGEKINHGYDSGKGIEVSFIMPDHDVKLECSHRNDMMAQPRQEPEFERPKEKDMLAQYLYSGEKEDRSDGYYLRIYAASQPGRIWIEQENMTGADSFYLLPEFIFGELCRLAGQYDLPSWNDLEKTERGNIYQSFYLRTPEGAKISVSSDRQPKNGSEILTKLGGHILSYVDGSAPYYVKE